MLLTAMMAGTPLMAAGAGMERRALEAQGLAVSGTRVALSWTAMAATPALGGVTYLLLRDDIGFGFVTLFLAVVSGVSAPAFAASQRNLNRRASRDGAASTGAEPLPLRFTVRF